jgi:hypothetical protein
VRFRYQTYTISWASAHAAAAPAADGHADEVVLRKRYTDFANLHAVTFRAPAQRDCA